MRTGPKAQVGYLCLNPPRHRCMFHSLWDTGLHCKMYEAWITFYWRWKSLCFDPHAITSPVYIKEESYIIPCKKKKKKKKTWTMSLCVVMEKYIHFSADFHHRCVKQVTAWEIRNEKSYFTWCCKGYTLCPPSPAAAVAACFWVLYISCGVGAGNMFHLMVIELLCARVWSKDLTWEFVLWRLYFCKKNIYMPPSMSGWK